MSHKATNNQPIVAHRLDDKLIVRKMSNVTEPEESKFQVNVLDQQTTNNRKDVAAKDPYETAGVFSRWTFSYHNPLFKLSKKKVKLGLELETEDVYPLQHADSSRQLLSDFEPHWADGKGRGYHGEKLVMYSLLKMLKFNLVWCTFLLLCRSLAQFSYPILISFYLNFVTGNSNDDTDIWIGYVLSILLAFAAGIVVLLGAQVSQQAFRTGVKARTTLSSLVFQKTLKLSQFSRAGITTGDIINYMQLDVQRIDICIRQLPFIVSGVVELVLLTGLVFYFIGYAAFAGFAVMVISLPVNKVLMQLFYKTDSNAMKCADQRVKATNEVMQHMLGVKIAAWEEKFRERITLLRSKQVSKLSKVHLIDSVLKMIVLAIPSLAAAAAVLTYSFVTGGEITAPTLFSTLLTFNRLRAPLKTLPASMTAALKAVTSCKRLGTFLGLDEVELSCMNPLKLSKLETNTHIEIREGTFYWTSEPKELDSDCEVERIAKGNPSKLHVTPFHKHRKDISSAKGNISSTTWKPVLKDISIQFRTGEITAIVGPVGCGKSALVQSILGETYRKYGSVTIRGDRKIAYCAQDPWVLNASISENITFGEPINMTKLRKVLQVCQLEHDLDHLPAGLDTMVGEKGITLSGGQKARLSIARAAYSTASIVVLDNPLSALDPGVASKLFDECIQHFLQGRTRVLVTNQLHVLEACDWIVVLTCANESNAVAQDALKTETSNVTDDTNSSGPGVIQEQGTFSQLQSSGLQFSALLNNFHCSNMADSTESNDHQETKEVSDADVTVDVESISSSTQNLQDEDDNTTIKRDANNDGKRQIVQGKKLMTIEERARGAVGFETYKRYIQACGGWFVFGWVTLLVACNRGVSYMALKWLSYWTNSAESNYTSVEPLPNSVINNTIASGLPLPLFSYSMGYLGFTMLDVLLLFISIYAVLSFTLRGSINMHTDMLQSVMYATMDFFDTTPIGRIMNRFSKDLSQLDTAMQSVIHYFVYAGSSAVTSIIVLVGTLPWFGIAVVPFVCMFYYLIRIYRPVSRDLQRLESIARSPLYSSFSEAVGGAQTIRAYQVLDQYNNKGSDLIDYNTRHLAMRMVRLWLQIRMELLTTVGVGFVGVLATQGSRDGWLRTGEVGVAFQYVDRMAQMIHFAFLSFVHLETMMTSAERILYYKDCLVQERSHEPNSKDDVVAIPESWPSSGSIKVCNLRMRYRTDTPLILRGVNFTIAGGERVGVCGRTGSGKSSLMKAILRIVEPELPQGQREGSVTIDDVDVSKVGLGQLRRSIGVVSQDPTIFSGTVRLNVDPFDEFTDSQIWEALEKCELKSFIQETEGKLEMNVSENGTNLSQGQRQLMALSRCLLQKSKLLFLDESTASLDFETDNLIQHAIRERFVGCTVLVIAHRIRTIIDSDKILVLDNGTVVEFDTPNQLLSNPSSQFFRMVQRQS